jgi:hypothetical protein
MLVNKLLVVNYKQLEFYLDVTENSNIIKNPVPILWNHQGIYGWIPIETVKNEINHFIESLKTSNFNIVPGSTFILSGKLKFTWQQAYRLRPDIGKMLEELANGKI